MERLETPKNPLRYALQAEERPELPLRLCPGCRGNFRARRTNQLHCSARCRVFAYRQRHGLEMVVVKKKDAPAKPAAKVPVRRPRATHREIASFFLLAGLALGTQIPIQELMQPTSEKNKEMHHAV